MSFTKEQGEILLDVAKQSIWHGIKKGSALSVTVDDYPEELHSLRATFVTLEIQHNLRGCIGTLTAYRPLVSDVAYHAHAAAFSDPRFPSLQPNEFINLDIHISILSQPEPMQFDSEEQLLQQIRPGIDGLILSDGVYKGTFLPSVWESLPNPRDFLTQLKQKANLPPEHWSKTVKVERYIAESIP